MATTAQDFSHGNSTNKGLKSNGEYVENLNAGPTHGTYFDNTEGLSAEHRQYLLDRHGTYDLDPVPDMGEADPYNWPQWKAVLPIPLHSKDKKC
jgi:hypothetical protein